MRFSVCIESVYANRPVTEAIAHVASVGMPAIEFWSWWDKDMAAIESAIDEHHLTLAGFCTRFFDLTNPDNRNQYLEGLEKSLQAAEHAGCRRLITQSGPARSDSTRSQQYDSLYAGLEACKPLLDQSEVTLLVEPLNTFRDHPDIFLSDTDEAFALIRALNHPRIQLLFDLYHQQISCGNILDTVLPNLNLIGHFHAASVPGRHQLDQGELHYGRIFRELDKAGYPGFVGLEYWPTIDPDQSLRQCLDLN